MVLGLGVILERAPAPKNKVSTMVQTKKRSGAERRRWLRDVELRIAREGKYVFPREQTNSLARSSEEGKTNQHRATQNQEHSRLSGHQELFGERRVANQGQRQRTDGVGHTAAVQDRLLRSEDPGLPLGRLKEASYTWGKDCGAASYDSSHHLSHTARPVPNRSATKMKHSTRGIIRNIGLLGKHHLARAKVALEGKNKDSLSAQGHIKGKGKEQCQETKPVNSSESHGPRSSKLPRATTSGLPAEITAGFFAAESGTARRREQEGRDWGNDACHSATLQTSKRATVQDEKAKSTERVRHVGCAPGPSSRVELFDNTFEQEYGFCSNCSPATFKEASGDATPSTSYSMRAPTAQPGTLRIDARPVRSDPRESESSFVPLRSSEAREKLATTALSSCAKNTTLTSPRNVQTHSSLPRTPGYRTVEPLLGRVQKILDASGSTTGAVPNLDGESKSPLRIDRLVVDEEAVWIKCSERLDHVSDTAAVTAWADIRKDRDETKLGEVQQTDHPASDRPRRDSGIKVLGSGTAETVQSQKGKVQAVDLKRANQVMSERVNEHRDRRPNSKGSSIPRRVLHAAKKEAPTATQMQKPLHLPWEGVWHNNLPKAHPIQRAQTPSEYSIAVSAPYSLGEMMRTDEEDTVNSTSPQGTQSTTSRTRNPPYHMPLSFSPLRQQRNAYSTPQSLNAAIFDMTSSAKKPMVPPLLQDPSSDANSAAQPSPTCGTKEAEDVSTASRILPSHRCLTSLPPGEPETLQPTDSVSQTQLDEPCRSSSTVAVPGTKSPIVRQASATLESGDVSITAGELRLSSGEPSGKVQEAPSPRERQFIQLHEGESGKSVGRMEQGPVDGWG